MDRFEEQYKEELHKQEIHANHCTMKGFLWILAGFTFVWLLTITNVFIVDKAPMTIAFVICAVICIFMRVIYRKDKMDALWVKYWFIAMICVITGIVGTFLTFHAALVYVLPLLFAIQYRERRVLWFSYFADGIAILVSMLLGFYYGICDLNMLYVSNHTRAWYLGRMTGDVIPIPFNADVNFVIVVYGVFPRMITLLVFVVMLRYIIISNQEDATRIAELTYRKEMDVSTRLFNKNKYEEMIEQYYPQKAWVAAIFWDVNNLKQINDRFGHAAGDVLLETVSSKLNDQTNERRRAYRVGGDEFIMLVENPVPGEPEEIIRNVREQLKKNREDGGLKVSSAVGWAEGPGSQIKTIVREADERMYEDKVRSKQGR